jgi:hypothetical protein
MPWTTHISGQNWTAADANYLGNRIIDSGTLAARPATGAQIGEHYYAQDTFQEFVWNGTTWIVFSEPWTAWSAVLLGPGPTASVAYSVGVTAGALYKRDNGRVTLLYSGTVNNLFSQTMTAGSVVISNLPFNCGSFIGTIYMAVSTFQAGVATPSTAYSSINPGGAGGSLTNGQISGSRDGSSTIMSGTLAIGSAVFLHVVGTTTT